MTYRRVILAVLGLADAVARLWLGLPEAFGVLMLVAVVGVPLSAAFLAADCIPLRRGHAVASGVALVGLPMALLIPVWGWIAALVVVAAQAVAWVTSRR
ncbi:MAG: hypothetical protein ISP32_04675 [Thermoleophilia bacterium]|nr:hypothetical protein [Thermoleophilia bacterium]